MKGLMRAVLATVAFLMKLGVLLAVAGLICALAVWNTVDQSFRASEVAVPDVRGLTLEAATERLAEKQLGVALEASRPHETLEPGLISYQDPVPGASTRKQRLVRVTLSAGQQLSTVPDLVGRSRREAVIELKTRHIMTGQAVQVASYSASDTVLAQSPSAGAPLEEGGRVDLLLSSGPRRRAFVMPDFVGQPAESARELVTQAGLRVAQERTEFAPGVEPGTVRSQDPPPGTRVYKDAPVMLSISRGAEPPGSTHAPSLTMAPAPPAKAPNSPPVPAPAGAGPRMPPSVTP